MSYFQNHHVSNSDLKSLKKKLSSISTDEIENLEEVFDLGTLIHQILLEPHKANRQHKDFELASRMAKTFMKDRLCRDFLFIHDFRREHEFYKNDLFGVPAKAKADGDSRILSTGLEYKGLGVTTHKAFLEAVERFDYDQGLAWYMDITGYKQFLIVAVSKKNPDRIFKELVDRDHKIYQRGRMKAELSVRTWIDFFGARSAGVSSDETFLIEDE